MGTIKPIIVKAIKPRDPFAMHAKRRKAVFFKDKRQERGGAKNRQVEYKDEAYG